MNGFRERALVFFVDFLTINAAWVVFFVMRAEGVDWRAFAFEPWFYLPALVIWAYWAVIFIFSGLYRSWFATSRLDEITAVFRSTFVGVFVLFFLIFLDDYSQNVASANRFVIFIYWGTLLGFVSFGRLTVRFTQRRLLIKGYGRRDALVVGFNEQARALTDQIRRHRELGVDVIGFVAVDRGNLGKSWREVPVLGLVDELRELIDARNVREVVVAVGKQNEDLMTRVIAETADKNVRLKAVPSLYDALSGQARTTQLYNVPLVDIDPELMSLWDRTLKRALDVTVSLLGLIFASPVMAAVAVGVKLDSPGPVFYSQERVGLNGKTFRIHKFRSMRQDAEKGSGPVWAQDKDPRITKFGNFLRKSRLDELPQFFNVLIGEMSLVGPRPERPFFVEKLEKEIPYFRRRLKVKPGMTGLSQVHHKYAASVEDWKERVHYDLLYIDNLSFRDDLKILLRTVYIVLAVKGHYD
ncbi:MAG: exopolysaccharide biosynthesis polyprenyl glycosylphosphotransferase [Ignavibacteriales bacterium]|nr:exopolysaccharide biosynthesis polyprenyl glycosylphosphotransferase [Ignavibacteriales bacterium]